MDGSGNVYLAGETSSTSDISTAGSHQTVHGGFIFDAYLVKFSGSGVRQWGTYYGGAGVDHGHSIVVDISGNIYLAGRTNSLAAMSTAGSHQPVHGGGLSGTYDAYDAFIVQFNSAGVRQWATYYGGTGDDAGLSVAVEGCGNVYLGGGASSFSSISTPGSHQPNYSGGYQTGSGHGKYGEAFLVKFGNCASSISVTTTGANICPGYCATVTANPMGGTPPFTYSWNPSGQTAASIAVCPSSTTAYSVTITDATGAVAMDTALVTIINCCSVAAVINSDPAPNTTFCVGQNVYMAASGGTSYVWNTGETDANIAFTLSITTTFSVTVTDAAGCTGTVSTTFIVDPNCTTTGISQLYNNALLPAIRPNPSNGIFAVDMGYGIAADAVMEIYNVMGEKVYVSALTPLSRRKGDGGEVLDLSSQPDGVYFLQVRTGQGRATQTLLIRK